VTPRGDRRLWTSRNGPAVKFIDTGAEWWLLDLPTFSGTYELTYFNDKYLSVVQGTGEGKYRKIEYASVVIDDDATILNFRLYDYFEDTLAGNSTANAEENSWVRIVDIAQDYQVDTWPCTAYLDEYKNIISDNDKNLILYSYTDEKIAKVTSENTDANIIESPYNYLRLPSYAYIDSGNSNKNKIIIDVKLFENDVDTMDSFIILPVKNPRFSEDLDPSVITYFNKWFTSPIGGYRKLLPGYWIPLHGGNPSNPLTTDSESDLIKITDKQSSTYFEFISVMVSRQIAFGIDFDLPDYPGNFTFDNIYLGIKNETLKSGAEDYGAIEFLFWSKFFIGELIAIIERYKVPNSGGLLGDNSNHLYEDLPDFYFEDASSSNNKLFYYNTNFVDFGTTRYMLTGYNNYSLANINKREVYENISNCGIFIGLMNGLAAYTLTNRLYELAIIFKKKTSIKDAIYSPLCGRKYNDTWGSRKTSDGLIDDPVNLFEHICRLQNWTDADDDSGVTNYGKEYSEFALIDTTTNEGGFDSIELASLKDQKIAFQLFDYDDGWTDTLKSEICKYFFLISNTNTTGKETIYSLLQYGGTIADTVTLADVPETMEIGEVEEPQQENVYCEPFVRFAMDNASGEYKNYIGITNVNKAAWQQSYTPGILGYQGERLWTLCHAMWIRYRHIERPPSNMTDNYMVYRVDDAIKYLDNWIYWMERKRITVPVYYEKAKSWNVGKHIYINLVHETDSESIECVIYSIEKNKNAGYCTLKMVMLENGMENFYIQDALYTESQGADGDVQDTMDTTSESESTDEDVQDVT
jgi:hypothetical protein